MRPKLKRIASLVLAILIVAQIAVAPAAAENKIEDQVGDAACSAGSALGPIAWLAPQCTVDYGEVDGATATELHYNVYAQGVFMEDTRDQVVVEKQSMINRSYGLAIAKAKWEIIEALNNGTSKAEAYSIATSTINDYYATIQKSLYVSQNRQIQQLKMIDQEIVNSGELSTLDVYSTLHNQATGVMKDDNHLQFENKTIELWDGRKINVTGAILIYDTDTDPSWADWIKTPLYYYNGKFGSVSWETSVSSTLNDVANDRQYMTYRSPSDTPSDPMLTTAADTRDFKEALTTIADRRSQAMDQVTTIVDQIYAEYDPGEISTAGAMGPLESVVAASTNYDKTGHSSYVLQTAQQMGLSVPDAASMTVKSDFDGDGANETRNGAIFAPSGTFPNGSIAVGRTYDTAALNNPVNFVWARENRPAKQIHTVVRKYLPVETQ